MTAAQLQKLLDGAGLSQRGAAKAIGINERTMRKYVLGELEIPRTVEYALYWLVHSEEDSMNITFPLVNPVPTSSGVIFQALMEGETHECMVSFEALQDHFGLQTKKPRDMAAAFIGGKDDIHRVARRKLPYAIDRCLLTTSDFD